MRDVLILSRAFITAFNYVSGFLARNTDPYSLRVFRIGALQSREKLWLWQPALIPHYSDSSRCASITQRHRSYRTSTAAFYGSNPTLLSRVA